MGKGKQFKNIAYYFGGTLLSALLGMISTPLLTRILSKEVYAQYGMVMTFTTALSTFLYLGQDEAFMRYFNSRKEGYWKFLARCLRYPLILCLITGLLLLEPSRAIVLVVFGERIADSACVLLCIYLLVLVIQRFLMLTARMEERAANYSLSNIMTKGLFLVVVWLLYIRISNVTLNGIILALTSGVLAAMIINIFVVIGVEHRANPCGVTISSKEMLKYGFPLALTTTMGFSIPFIEKIVIRESTNWNLLAIYTAASVFVTVMNMVKVTVSNIWTPYAYKAYQNESEFKKAFFYIGISLTFFVICILSGTILTRRWLVLILNRDYFDVMIIAPAMVCGACFDVLSTVYSIGIYIKKKTLNRTIVPIIRILISLPILAIGLPNLGLKATGLAYLLSIAVSRTVEIRMALHYYGTGRSNYKLIALMGMGIAISILSLFFTSLRFDIFASGMTLLISMLLVKNEIVQAIKWIRTMM